MKSKSETNETIQEMLQRSVSCISPFIDLIKIEMCSVIWSGGISSDS